MHQLSIYVDDVIRQKLSISVCDQSFVFAAAGCTGQIGKRTR